MSSTEPFLACFVLTVSSDVPTDFPILSRIFATYRQLYTKGLLRKQTISALGKAGMIWKRETKLAKGRGLGGMRH